MKYLKETTSVNRKGLFWLMILELHSQRSGDPLVGHLGKVFLLGRVSSWQRESHGKSQGASCAASYKTNDSVMAPPSQLNPVPSLLKDFTSKYQNWIKFPPCEYQAFNTQDFGQHPISHPSHKWRICLLSICPPCFLFLYKKRKQKIRSLALKKVSGNEQKIQRSIQWRNISQ